MSFVKCFDVVSMVIEAADEQFQPLWKINEENRDILRQYCDVIDSMARESDAECFEVEVDDIKMTVRIAMICHEMTIKSQTHIYCQLIERTVSCSYSVTEDGGLRVEFEFPSLWERVRKRIFTPQNKTEL